MEVTKNFEKVIEAFIEKEKKEDKLFAECVDSQPKKTIKGCVNYILKEVQKSKICGWTDEEIFGMAKHFYDEKELKDPGAVKAGRVVVNYHIDLSESEKEEAKQKALEEFKRDERLKLEAEKRKADEKERLKAEAKRKLAEKRREKESKMQLDLFD